ncbi:MAG TPA: carboxypeptidase-like regulatory domain-containing protein [Longimicrobium sp.]|nr:carboxypeptidase-like regulatory domain-containing protein [Longimicrobium sp.]
MEPETSGGRVAGRVVDPGGSPVAEAAVMITSGPPHADMAALTGADGDFSFLDLAPGEYTFLANAPDHPPETRTVRVGPGEAARLEIRLGGG